MYYRSHCLANMPKRAADRLRTRLRKKSELIQRDVVGGVNDDEIPGGADMKSPSEEAWSYFNLPEKP